MKVFYILMKFPTNAETFATNDIVCLKEKGIDISVHSLRNKSRNSDQLIKERQLEKFWMTNSNLLSITRGILFGIKKTSILLDFLIWIFKTNYRKKEHLLKSLLLVPRALSIFRTIETERPDYVHLFWGHYPSLVGYLTIKHSQNTKVTMFLGAYDLEMEYSGSKWVTQNSQKVFTHAYYNVPMIKALEIDESKILVSHRGVNLKKFNHKSHYEKINRRIVCAGRLIKSKGVDDVIRVFAEVKKEFSDASLVILGDGEEKENLESLAKKLNLDINKDIVFKGHVDQLSLFEEMIKAKVFIMLSKKQSERLPNVVKEAMLAKCLCIVSETPGIEELINDNSGYIIKDENSVEEATHILYKIFNKEVDSTQKVDAAYNHIVENFDLSLLMDNYLSVWDS